eukprot:TRINITY_DN19958_c0_g1_i1.p1 TRINITY_DN19958_c0_g1~~TRINITY_DN19958_c0_g1_i1.p1  ORF type:complete len:261 (+),score=29.25 TRINITY_DN19958_c0_g1_i1:98-784(+)
MEGFLFGTISQEEVKTFADRGAQGTKNKVSVAIQGFLPCGKPLSFYDHYGELSKEKYKAFVSQNNNRSVLGWFKFRRNSPLRPSLREMEVHNQLQKAISPFFLMGLFTASISTDKAIHSYDYRMMTVDPNTRSIAPVKLEIVNLISGAQEEYNSFAAVSPIPASERAYAPLFNIKDMSHVGHLENVFQSSFKKLETSAQRMYDSTVAIRQLEAEIAQLEKRKKDKVAS